MTVLGGFGDGADDLEELADALEDVADDIDEAVDAGIKQTAFQVERSAKQNAPVDSGTLRWSIEARRLDIQEWVVGTPVEYAAEVEYGTGPRVITSNDDGPMKFKVGGQWISKHRVEHPGTPAQPYMRPALRANQSELPKNIAAAIDDLLDEHL